MLGVRVLRRSASLWSAVGLALLVAAAPQASHAITVSDCAGSWKDYLNALDAYYDGNVPDEDVTEVLSTGPINLEFINSIDDPENLSESAKEWRRQMGQRSGPPSDYDQITTARQGMYVCMYEQRLAEVQGVEAEPEPAAPAREPEPEPDLSGPPTIIEPSLPWFTSDDYPASALRAERQGEVRYILTIDAGGKVRGCQADGPEGAADLESATCDALMARAQFNPATDARGKPTVGEFEGSIKWTVPN